MSGSLSRLAQTQEARGIDFLKRYLSRAELDAYERDPAAGRRFLGHALHRAVADALDEQFQGRFIYRTRGPDFIDTSTGEMIELTTPAQVGSHMARPGYGAMSYSTYSFSPGIP